MVNVVKMSVKREQICRLCLKVTESNCNDVDETTKLMFHVLMLKLDLNITRDPVVCQDCMGIAKKCLDFKYTCVKTETVLLTFAIASKKAKHYIEILCKEREDAEAVDEDFNICRFCMTQLQRNEFVSLDILMNGTEFDMLSVYLPETDFNVIQNPTICATCREMLEGYFQFVLNCLDIEAKIKSYCREGRSDNMYQIDNVLHSLFKGNLFRANRHTQIRGIKQESNRLEDTECMYTEASSGLIKQEELYIKEERTDEYTYQQMVPGNIVKDKRGYRRCMLVHKDISEKEMFTCSLCAYKTKYKDSLKTHMLIHKDVSEIKMLRCPQCSKEYKTKKTLKSHMLVHKNVSEKEMFACSLCAYKTKYNDRLKKHMAVHKDVSEIEMFTCPLCAYTAKYKSRLETHMVVHKDISETKMFTCSLCTHKTKYKRHLETHMLIHKDISEIKMLKCPQCSNEYKYKKTLKRHIMLVHKNVSEMKMFIVYTQN